MIVLTRAQVISGTVARRLPEDELQTFRGASGQTG
jgi:hypothetical protein